MHNAEHFERASDVAHGPGIAGGAPRTLILQQARGAIRLAADRRVPPLVAFLADWNEIDRLRFQAMALGLQDRVAVHHRAALRVVGVERRSA